MENASSIAMIRNAGLPCSGLADLAINASYQQR
jgi:hypothetical protein